MKFGVISINLREFSAFLLNFSQILRLNFERIYEFHAKFTQILKFQAKFRLNFEQILKFCTKFQANFKQNSAKISREFLNFKPKFNAKFSVNFKGKNYA